MLHKDDIEGIQKLYGKKMKEMPKKSPKTSEEEWDDYWENFEDSTDGGRF